jgi:hypothetical protein
MGIAAEARTDAWLGTEACKMLLMHVSMALTVDIRMAMGLLRVLVE